MNGISLTASMRSNLLSLQNISGQVSSTQNKLSTGNKVNSAIDNPSSYYTALSLNNRADDLNALLDSMGQAISTIKAATTALESATEFLEQAKAVANQALETAKVPGKSFFEEKVGENGAVVTTAQELKDAIAAGKETICVYGAIDLGDISTTGGLELKENQKLVGVGYFGNYDTDTNKFSSLSATSSVIDRRIVNITQNGSVVSDLSLSHTNNVQSGTVGVVRVEGKGILATLGNLDIKVDFSNDDTNGIARAAIGVMNGSSVDITDKINIDIVSGRLTWGVYANNSVVNIKNANVTVQDKGSVGYGIVAYTNSTINIDTTSKVNLNISSGYGVIAHDSSVINIKGNIIIETQNSPALYNSALGGNQINIFSSARLYFNRAKNNTIMNNSATDGASINLLSIAAGAKLATEKDGKTDWYEVKASWQDKNDSTTTSNSITLDNIKDILNVEETSAWELPEKIEEDSKEEAAQNLSGDSKQYQEILNQYDSLIKDANYKGINLLQPEKLTVKFNEDNTAALEVQGRDMSSKALGFTIFDWQTQGDINASIEELTSAINSIRNYSSELGNNYNIITTRQDFTDSLINVLTEGADKLTLADMNEESANMLALQTRQQLAINSLSLASQASQSILKLF